MTRTKKTSINFIVGIFSQFITIFLPFLIRALVISKLGAEYLGLSSVVLSILNVLNLTELGFSSAIVFSLYKPLADDDKIKIGALLNYYKKIYRIIGLVILSLGVLLVPFLSFFIKEDVPADTNIYIVFLIYLLNTVLSYFLFSYKRSILIADQKNYITTLVNVIMLIIQTIIQIIILFVVKNFYLYIIILPLITIVSNLFITIITNKYYKEYFNFSILDVDTKKELKTKIMGLFIFKVTMATRTSFDSIFISAYLGLVFVAIYSNYYYVMTGVISLLAVITTSMTASVGNKTATDSKEDNYKDFVKFDCLHMLIVGWCAVMLLILYQPFMNLWVGNELVLPFGTMILFVIYFYANKMGSIRAMYNDVNGLWWEQRYRTIIEAILNVFLNWLLVYFFGLFGIVLATIITILIFGYGLSASITFKHYFGLDKLKSYYLSHIKYIIVTIMIAVATYYISSLINISNVYVDFVATGAVAACVSGLLFLIIYIRNPHLRSFINIFSKKLLKRPKK